MGKLFKGIIKEICGFFFEKFFRYISKIIGDTYIGKLLQPYVDIVLTILGFIFIGAMILLLIWGVYDGIKEYIKKHSSKDILLWVLYFGIIVSIFVFILLYNRGR